MAKGKVKIDQERCNGCGLCVAFCPRGLLAIGEAVNAAGRRTARFLAGREQKDCDGCADCALMCPAMAMEVSRG